MNEQFFIKKNGTGQWKKDKGEEKRNVNTVEHSIRENKERKNEHFYENRQFIDWKKKEEKSWTFVNFNGGYIVLICWLVGKFVQEKKKSLFEFKGDIEFFFCFILWKKNE